MTNVSLLDKWQLVQTAIADPHLSANAKCALAALLEFRDHKTGRCYPAYTSVADRIGLKRRAAINLVAELAAGGWLQTVKGGGRKHTNAIVFNFEKVHRDTPSEGEKVHQYAPLSSQPVHDDAPFKAPESDKGCTATTKGVHDGAPKPYQYPERDVLGERARAPDGAPRFSDFMAIYPKKVGEKNARFHWDRIVAAGEATAAELLAGARRYAESRQGENLTYTQAPANWLRGAHWKDEIALKSDGPPPDRRGRGERMTAGQAMMAAAYNPNARG